MKTITPQDLKKRLDAGESITLIDVRESHEVEICSIGGSLIPLKSVVERRAEIPQDGEVVVYCRSGGRSGMAVQELEAKWGYKNLYNLEGGMLRWIDDVDPTLTKY